MFRNVARPCRICDEDSEAGCRVGKHVVPVGIGAVPEKNLSEKFLENHGNIPTVIGMPIVGRESNRQFA